MPAQGLGKWPVFGGQIISFPSILTAGKRSAYGLRKWISSPRREKKVNAGEKNQSAYRPLSYLPDQTSLKTIRKRGQTGLRPVKHTHCSLPRTLSPPRTPTPLGDLRARSTPAPTTRVLWYGMYFGMFWCARPCIGGGPRTSPAGRGSCTSGRIAAGG